MPFLDDYTLTLKAKKTENFYHILQSKKKEWKNIFFKSKVTVHNYSKSVKCVQIRKKDYKKSFDKKTMVPVAKGYSRKAKVCITAKKGYKIVKYTPVNTEPEDRERSKMEAQSLWMENIICRYCIRIPAKIMYHRYIWMDIVCRDDEKEPGDRFLFSCLCLGYYLPKYLLSRPANAFPCLASSLAISCTVSWIASRLAALARFARSIYQL